MYRPIASSTFNSHMFPKIACLLALPCLLSVSLASISDHSQDYNHLRSDDDTANLIQDLDRLLPYTEYTSSLADEPKDDSQMYSIQAAPIQPSDVVSSSFSYPYTSYEQSMAQPWSNDEHVYDPTLYPSDFSFYEDSSRSDPHVASWQGSCDANQIAQDDMAQEADYVDQFLIGDYDNLDLQQDTSQTVVPSDVSDDLQQSTSSADEYVNGHDTGCKSKARAIKVKASHDDELKQRQKNYTSQNRKYVKSRETQFWRGRKRHEKQLLVQRIKTLTDGRYTDRVAQTQLSINLTQDLYEDMMSDDDDRIQRALHFIDFGMTDDVFTRLERDTMYAWIKRKNGKKYHISSPVLSIGRRHLSEGDKAWIRLNYKKTPKQKEEIARLLETAYRYGKALEKRVKRGSKLNDW